MLLIAIGLHGFFIFAPLRPQIERPQEQSGESVKLTRLTELKQAPEKSESVADQAPNVSVLRQPSILLKPSPSPSPSPAASPAPTPPAKPSPQVKKTQNKPRENQAAAKTSSQASDAAPKLDPEEQTFVQRFQKLENREVTEPVSSTLFPDPDYFYTDPIQEIGKPGVIGIEYVSLQRPDEVHEQLVRLYPDYAIGPKSEYGNGTVYEFKKGAFVRYLNLVRAKLGAGTLIILWNQPPG